MNKTVFKTFLTQMASPQLSHRIEHKAGLPCAPFCNLIVGQSWGLGKFGNNFYDGYFDTFCYQEEFFKSEMMIFQVF